MVAVVADGRRQIILCVCKHECNICCKKRIIGGKKKANKRLKKRGNGRTGRGTIVISTRNLGK